MTKTTDSEAISKGVTDAFDFWLSQHDITFPSLLEHTIAETFGDWLDANSETIIDRIAQRSRTDL